MPQRSSHRNSSIPESVDDEDDRGELEDDESVQVAASVAAVEVTLDPCTCFPTIVVDRIGVIKDKRFIGHKTEDGIRKK